nr:uromodulin-like 1 [Pelodiscus sinensis]|eukprot:XP_025039635.1 uromodulin-like 1 [Pelodiscus sinensis]
MCCLFPRLPVGCRHIQLLQNNKSSTASFTVQLFQMLNHSTAYLHCKFAICLNDHAGCEQNCYENRETIPQRSDRSSFRNLHSLISVGPVLEGKPGFLEKQAEGPSSAVLIPVVLGSLTGVAVLGSIFICLWLHLRCKTKSLCSPQCGETYSL